MNAYNLNTFIVKQFPLPFRRLLKSVIYHNYIHAFWHKDGNNWGDALNPVMLELLSGRKPRFTSDLQTNKFLVLGSILEIADKRTVVWGAGFIKKGLKTREKPKKVCAVRGPLSRAQLMGCGVDVPEVYGDPALLLPRFYNPKIERSYEIGVVPHYVDKHHPWLKTIRNEPKISIIDIESNTFAFVRSLKSCNLILSSSLHGLICADAYGIPCLWVEFSDQVIGSGYKFYDYFASVNRNITSPITISDGVTINKIASLYAPYKIKINLELLLNACPFLRKRNADIISNESLHI